MKIALAYRWFDLRGGSERVFYRTAQGLQSRGHEVHLFCGRFFIEPPQGTFAHKVPYVPRPRTARVLSFAVFAPRVIARVGCDVSLSFDRMLYQDVFRSGGGAHEIFVESMIEHSRLGRTLFYRTSPYHRLLPALERYILGGRGCRRVIAVCEQVKTDLIRAYGVKEEKVVVIPNGVDHERFHPARRKLEGRRVRQQLGIPAQGRVVVFVGTGFRRKGLERLLHLWDAGFVRGAYLLVVGNDVHLSRYRDRWQRGDVLFVGAQPKVEEFYAAADLLVLPSLQEAFGNVVLEALAAGLPVITVRGVGAADGLRGELARGLLDDPDDAAELADKIEYLLDPKRWPALSCAARTLAEGYTWDKYLDRVEEQLRIVAGANSGQWRVTSGE